MPSLAVMASGRKVLWVAWKGFQETNVEPDEATTKLIIDQVSTSYGKKPMEELERRRDRKQLAILRALAAEEA
jgi:hypothetical protein